MFYDFKKLFLEPSPSTEKIPEAVLETLSEDYLPEGLAYEDQGGGVCTINISGLNLSLDNFCIDNNLKQRVLREKNVLWGLLKFSYNMQIPLKLQPDSNGNYIVDGKPVDANWIMLHPLQSITPLESELYIIPSPFPKAVNMIIAGDGEELTLEVKRKTIDSIHKGLYGNNDDAVLHIEICIDDINSETDIRFSLGKSSSAKEMLASRKIYNALLDGRAYLQGSLIEATNMESEGKIPDDIIRFWGQMVEVERTLGYLFDITYDITDEVVNIVKSLYRCLVEKKPYRVNAMSYEINGVGTVSDDLRRRTNDDAKGEAEETILDVAEQITVDLFGHKFDLYRIGSVFQGMISVVNIATENGTDKFKIRLVPLKGKEMYISYMYYWNEPSRGTFCNDSSFREMLRNAREL